MQGNERDDLYRLPSEEHLPLDTMKSEEIELRRHLAVLSREPDDPDALIRVADILMSQKLYQEADLYLDRYLKLKPEDPRALNWSGVACFARGDYEKAESLYEQALICDRDHHDALYNLAMLHSAQGNFEKSRECFERLTRLEPDNPEVLNNLGALLYEAGDLPGAEEKFRQALEREPANAPAAENLMQVLKDGGRNAEAEELAEACAKTDPSGEVPGRPESIREGPPAMSGMNPDYAQPYPVEMPDGATPSATGNIMPVGLTVGIVSDWCPGDRGDLGWWIRRSLERNGHQPHVLAKTGMEPHCKGGDRTAPPRTLGQWVVPNLAYAKEVPLPPEAFDSWLSEADPDAVLFVDEADPALVDRVHAAGAAAIACPALVGAKNKTASSFSMFDAVLAVTPWIHDVLEERVPRDRLIPCDLGIDVDAFAPASLRGSDTVFLYDAGHGSVEDLENFLSMLTAFGMMKREAAEGARLLVRSHVEWHLFPQEIRKRGEGNPRIDVISGHIDDCTFLHMGDVLIHLKTSPGIHWIVPRAAASGVPSIVLDKSPATGWIFDEHMILKIPCDPGMGFEGVGRTGDLKTLADTMATLATDREMVEYMGGICRDKTRQILDGVERGRAICDKIVTALAAWKDDGMAPPAAAEDACWTGRKAAPDRRARKENAPEDLLNAIEDAISSGKNDQARELMSLYRQSMV